MARGKLLSRMVIALILMLLFVNLSTTSNNNFTNSNDFSKNLSNLRDITQSLSDDNTFYLLKRLSESTDLQLLFLFQRISQIEAYVHIYIQQLNQFDSTRESIVTQEIPSKNKDYCCWKVISIVHMNVSYEVQEILKDEVFRNSTYDSLIGLLELNKNLKELDATLNSFDKYFANYPR